MGCLIVFRSVTYAQNAQNLLGKHHISTVITRPPAELAKGGCSYALRLREGDMEAALAVLRRLLPRSKGRDRHQAFRRPHDDGDFRGKYARGDRLLRLPQRTQACERRHEGRRGHP